LSLSFAGELRSQLLEAGKQPSAPIGSDIGKPVLTVKALQTLLIAWSNCPRRIKAARKKVVSVLQRKVRGGCRGNGRGEAKRWRGLSRERDGRDQAHLMRAGSGQRGRDSGACSCKETTRHLTDEQVKMQMQMQMKQRRRSNRARKKQLVVVHVKLTSQPYSWKMQGKHHLAGEGAAKSRVRPHTAGQELGFAGRGRCRVFLGQRERASQPYDGNGGLVACRPRRLEATLEPRTWLRRLPRNLAPTSEPLTPGPGVSCLPV